MHNSSVYLDTSCIISFLYPEIYSEKAESIHSRYNQLFISQLTTIELISALNKKVRISSLTTTELNLILNVYNSNIKKGNYIVLDMESAFFKAAEFIISNSTQPIRTLDAIQLGIAQNQRIPIASFDKVLLETAKENKIPVVDE